MRTNRIISFGLLGCLGLSASAQDWLLGGNPVAVTDYLGAKAASVAPLHLRTIPNLSIDFSTSDLLRMRLHPIQSSNINGCGAGSITQDGFLGLSDQPVFFAGAPGPFSRLHLVDGAGTVAPAVFASEFGFRKWMRNGVTFSGNSDQGYIGQKYKMQGQSQLVDQTDMVLQWSSDPEGEVGPDHLRFIFTGGRNTTTNPTTGWNSEEGLEAMRILPVDEFQSFVGVGDFFAGGVEPSERLDVLDRTIRIRRLVPDYQNDALTRVMMTDVNGRVHWRDIATWPQTPSPGAGCDWEIDASLNRIYTAWRGVGTNASCPEVDWKVGIGVTHPGYKLDVLHDAANGGGSGGLRVRFTGPSTGWSYGMKSELTPSSGGILANAAGVHSLVSGGTTECWGVLSNATATTATSVSLGGATATANATSGSITTAYGTRSLVVTNPSATLTTAYGSYGETQGAGLATKAYGMYGYGQRGSQETYGGYFWGNGPLGTTTTYGVYG